MAATDPYDESCANITSFEAGRMLADLKALRRSIISAWQERGIMLTPEQQRELRDEIRETCELLMSLTRD